MLARQPTFPLKLAAGFGANPGAYSGLKDVEKKLAEQFQARFTKGAFGSAVTFSDKSGGETVVINTHSDLGKVWNLEKAFDTPDLVAFTGMPIDAVDLPIQGAGATNSGTACTTIEFSGLGSFQYNNQTHDDFPPSNGNCGGSQTTNSHQLASGVAWDDKWVNQVFGGRANSAALNGSEDDSGTVFRDSSTCAVNDPNNQCSQYGTTTCTDAWSGTCSGAIAQGQGPTLEYTQASDHLIGKVFIGYGKTSPCTPAWQIGRSAAADVRPRRPLSGIGGQDDDDPVLAQRLHRLRRRADVPAARRHDLVRHQAERPPR